MAGGFLEFGEPFLGATMMIRCLKELESLRVRLLC